MNELDSEKLRAVSAWAEARLDAADRRARMKPLWEAMQKSMAHTMTVVVPDIMAGPQAMVRRSVSNMETSLAAFPAKLAEADREYAERLEHCRGRTALLRAWLQELS